LHSTTATTCTPVVPSFYIIQPKFTRDEQKQQLLEVQRAPEQHATDTATDQ